MLPLRSIMVAASPVMCFCSQVLLSGFAKAKEGDHVIDLGTGTGIIPMEEYLNMMTTVGASGAVYAILLAFGMLFPDNRLFIFPLPFPIKAKFFVIGYAAIELWSGLANNIGDNVAHFAHLGGMLFGLILILYWRKKSNNNGTYYS